MGNCAVSSGRAEKLLKRLQGIKKEFDALSNKTSGQPLFDLLYKICCLVGDFEDDEESMRLFISEELGIVKLLIDLMKNNNFQGDIILKCCEIFRVALISTHVQITLAARPLGLVDILKKVLEMNSVGNSTSYEALNALAEMLRPEETHEFIYSEQLQLCPLVTNFIQTTSHAGTKEWAMAVLLNGAVYGPASTVEKLAGYGAHNLALDIIRQAGPNTSSWTASHEYANMLIMAMARHPFMSQFLKTKETLDLMAGIARDESNGHNINISICTIVFLVGKEERSEKMDSFWHYLNIVSDSVERLLDTFHKMVVVKDGITGFNIRVIMSAFVQLCMSDTNKVTMGSSSFLNCTDVVLDAYISSGDVLRGRKSSGVVNTYGGGGKDVEAAELTIEVLTLLSFLYEDTEDLQKNLMTPDSKVVDRIEALLTGDAAAKLSREAVENAKLLHKRLTTSNQLSVSPEENTSSSSSSSSAAAENIGISIVPSAKPFHLMCSYCWSRDSKPELVKATAEGLVVAGRDVWRDEVSIVCD